MNTAPAQMQQPLQHFQQLIESGAATLPGRGREWLDTQRAFAFKQFLQQGFPTRADEAWRYTSLERVLDQPWSLQAASESAAGVDIGSLRLADDAAARLVFVNGRWDAGLSDIRVTETALHIGSLRMALDNEPDALADWLGQAMLPPPERDAPHAQPSTLTSFAALNTALLDDGAWVHIPAGTHVDGPIELVFLSTAQDAAPVVQPRNLIVLEDGASATLVEHYASLHSAAYFTNALSEVHLGDDARLEHARLQDEGPAARHLSQVFLRQGHGSHYQGLSISLGGQWSRTEYHNPMLAEHAHCALNGLYVAGDRQLTDVHLDIEHVVPHCSSRERFKGILLGRGRAVFDGRIRVQIDAQKTDAQLSNDNLLLSRDAEVDTKPQLEIFADDVKCSHGTTVGQLEPAQMFYLRTRGIDADTARRMLCMGFATELLDGCTIAGLRERVEQRLAQRLSEAGDGTGQ